MVLLLAFAASLLCHIVTATAGSRFLARNCGTPLETRKDVELIRIFEVGWNSADLKLELTAFLIASPPKASFDDDPVLRVALD
jgi:hypothetical protein